MPCGMKSVTEKAPKCLHNSSYQSLGADSLPPEAYFLRVTGTKSEEGEKNKPLITKITKGLSKGNIPSKRCFRQKSMLT